MNKTLQRFSVTMNEMLNMTVEVETKNQQEAEQMVFDGWRKSAYILDANHFRDVEFEAIPIADGK